MQSASAGSNFSAETGTASSARQLYLQLYGFRQRLLANCRGGNRAQSLTKPRCPGPRLRAALLPTIYIERCTGLGCSNFSQIASVSGSTLTYTDTTISSGTVYNYRVRAEDTSGTFSPYSTVQALSPIVPYVVSSFSATPIRTLSWNPSAESGGTISQYSIERCTGRRLLQLLPDCDYYEHVLYGYFRSGGDDVQLPCKSSRRQWFLRSVLGSGDSQHSSLLRQFGATAGITAEAQLRLPTRTPLERIPTGCCLST